MQTAAGQARATLPSSRGRVHACAPERVLDPAAFASLAGVLEGPILAQIYREFLVQTRSRLHELSLRHDRELRAALAHSIKGTAGMLGALSIAGCAESLECVESEREIARLLHLLTAACTQLDGALRQKGVEL